MSAAFIHLLHFPVYTLGPGTRVGLWFQGCSLHCPGCVTPESWDFGPNPPQDVGILAGRLRTIFEHAAPDGLTISGGEPFDQPEALFELLCEVRTMGMEDVLIYSGYPAADVVRRHHALPGLAAALVDGPFELGRVTDSAWKGSDNQSLTIWREKFSARYEEWARGKKGKLQFVKDGDRAFLVGIPRQGDAERLRKPF
ncbi:MAG: radical SAM protein [Synergistaceae bacterium]|jgi:anaerobic ribonucleoside-triphosphate reductase activating protein|nr:radical SAM protein [Synergistaceae bacterium]